MFSDMRTDGYKIFTPHPVNITTYFFLKLSVSETRPLGCGIATEIYDTQPMYHLDLRINVRNMYMKLAQSSKVDGTWTEDIASYEDMELPPGANYVGVRVDSDYFRVWINGKKFKNSIPVDPDRLLKYSHLTLKYYGSCASVDLESSYAEFPGLLNIIKIRNLFWSRFKL